MWLCRVAVAFGVASLILVLVNVVSDGLAVLSPDFVASYPSRFPERAGIRSAIRGSAWMLALVAVLTFPLGVGAALYLE